LFLKVFKTITGDNSSEFRDLLELGKGLQIDVYFRQPYVSSNEHHNDLIRRFIKKGQATKSINNSKTLYSGFSEGVASNIRI